MAFTLRLTPERDQALEDLQERLTRRSKADVVYLLIDQAADLQPAVGQDVATFLEAQIRSAQGRLAGWDDPDLVEAAKREISLYQQIQAALGLPVKQ